ncbi:MAG TPA: DUF2306 domain-containing protein [Phenylobacterium sp.]
MTTRAAFGPRAYALWGVTAFLSVGVAGYAYAVLSLGGSPGPQVLANLFARPWLLVHAAGAGTALLTVAFQFLPAIRRRRAVHRWIGRVYGAAVIVSGSAGLALSVGTTAGPIAGLGFGLLAAIWIYVTSQGWLAARARRFDEHRRWMIRSFSLTFAAVTLRLYMPAAGIAGLDMGQAYVAIAWLAWVPNLALAELYLRREGVRREQVA